MHSAVCVKHYNWNKPTSCSLQRVNASLWVKAHTVDGRHILLILQFPPYLIKCFFSGMGGRNVVTDTLITNSTRIELIIPLR